MLCAVGERRERCWSGNVQKGITLSPNLKQSSLPPDANPRKKTGVQNQVDCCRLGGIGEELVNAFICTWTKALSSQPDHVFFFLFFLTNKDNNKVLRASETQWIILWRERGADDKIKIENIYLKNYNVLMEPGKKIYISWESDRVREVTEC